jgi:hypothetical protein
MVGTEWQGGRHGPQLTAAEAVTELDLRAPVLAALNT